MQAIRPDDHAARAVMLPARIQRTLAGTDVRDRLPLQVRAPEPDSPQSAPDR